MRSKVDPLSSVLRFFPFLWPSRRKWVLGFICGVAASGLALLYPWVAKRVVDEGVVNRDFRVFLVSAAGTGILLLLKELTTHLQDYLYRSVRLGVRFRLGQTVFAKLQSLSFSWFQDKASGEHLYKLDYDIDCVTDFVTAALPEAVEIFLRLFFLVGVIFIMDATMALFVVVFLPFLFWPTYYFNRKMERIWESAVDNAEGIFKDLSEVFSHIALIKIFNAESASRRIFLKRSMENVHMMTRNLKLEATSHCIANGIARIIVGAVILFGFYRVIGGRMTLGGLTAFLVYLAQLVELHNQSAALWQTGMRGKVSCGRLAEILDEKTMLDASGEKNAVFRKGGISFEDITFGYRPQAPLLQGMTFEIEGGRHVALAGPSGCGKTTLLNLLVRLYTLWSGRILIDGEDIKQLSFGSLRGQIGFVLQEPFLWNDTIKNNIVYGHPEANEEEILHAAKMAGVDEFVRALKDGYATSVGENACKLSEGQKQKIAIARALIRKPKILILDEAMASMDSISEEGIISNIKRNYPGTTFILVSHRLSAIMTADLVYYFSKRSEMIIDSPQRLLGISKNFSDLFAGQTVGASP